MTAPPRTHTAAQLQGYAMVGGSFLIMGSIGALVDYSSAPESMLLVLRMAIAAVVLGMIFARRRPLAGLRTPGVPLRLLVLCVVDTMALLFFFVALRSTNVAIGMFLTFTAPVWVALIAPRVLRTRTEPVVYVAVLIALGGLATIVVPSLTGEVLHVSVPGLFLGAASGLGYATFQMMVKGLSRHVSSVTIVLSETVLDSLILLPLALWQTVGAGYALTRRDLLVAAILGVVCTALAYTLWTEGQRRVRVQHASILGYLEPVSAPVYALLLLGEHPNLWTLVGGALIIIAGALVMYFGEPEELMPT